MASVIGKVAAKQSAPCRSFRVAMAAMPQDILPFRSYSHAIAKHHTALIVPENFPELGMLLWNHDRASPLRSAEVAELARRLAMLSHHYLDPALHPALPSA